MRGIIGDLVSTLVLVGMFIVVSNWLGLAIPWWSAFLITATVHGVKRYHAFSVFRKDKENLKKIADGIKPDTWVMLTYKDGRKEHLFYLGCRTKHELIRNERGYLVGYGFRNRFVAEAIFPQGYSGGGIDLLIPGCEIISMESTSPPSGIYWI